MKVVDAAHAAAIDKLKAGPKLDALMAEEVMGWHRRKDFWATDYFYDSFYRPGDWSPSTSIFAAFEVVEEFKGTVFNLNNRGPWYAHFQSDRPSYHVSGIADTAPLAICRAAWKAKMAIATK